MYMYNLLAQTQSCRVQKLRDIAVSRKQYCSENSLFSKIDVVAIHLFDFSLSTRISELLQSLNISPVTVSKI